MSTATFTTTGTTTSSTGASGLAGQSGLGEVPETTGQLRAQARHVDALAEQLQLLLGVIGQWSAGLVDRLAGASWGSEQITAAAEAVGATGEDLDALTDQLAALEEACRSAANVGAEASATSATGAAQAFQPA